MLLTNELTELIDKTAVGVSRAYRVELDDVKQEMWEWVLTHERMVERNLDPENPQGPWRVSKALWSAGKRYALLERAQRDGYSVDDVYFYDIPTIEAVLPYALGIAPLEDTVLTAPAPEDRSRTKRQPNEGNNFVVMVADVELGLQTVSPDDRAFLTVAIEYDREWEALAGAFDIQARTARKRYGRVVRRVQDALGGADPWYRGERTGSRKALSNAQAMAMTHFEQDGAA